MAYLLDTMNPTTYIHTYIQSEKKARHSIPLGYDKPDKIHTYIHTYTHIHTQSEKKARRGIPLGYDKLDKIHIHIHTHTYIHSLKRRHATAYLWDTTSLTKYFRRRLSLARCGHSNACMYVGMYECLLCTYICIRAY